MSTEDMKKLGQDGMAAALSSLTTWSKGTQAIALEIVDYSKKSAEGAAAAWEKVMGAASLEQVMQMHTEYLTASYQNLVAETVKLSKLYVDLASEFFRPLDGARGKVTTSN